ncbi:hypothetical protein C1Y40_05843 [Mycobacterium talmoniae]|uniref:Uncharacterized protein n=1 Tax=Mycobacterium talmoniae TaxID=1858794 RepID=A0A2S8BBG7_9MYCO|nr:hypothetical protein C1Y40_05843 [Mycobacterium talmoniae]
MLIPGPSRPDGVAARVSLPPSLAASVLIFCSVSGIPPSWVANA